MQVAGVQDYDFGGAAASSASGGVDEEGGAVVRRRCRGRGGCDGVEIGTRGILGGEESAGVGLDEGF
jgi:hypothetical protein